MQQKIIISFPSLGLGYDNVVKQQTTHCQILFRLVFLLCVCVEFGHSHREAPAKRDLLCVDVLISMG